MQLVDLTLKHLWRKKTKALFLLLGIIIGVTTIVTLFVITTSMNEEINNKFDLIGSNMIVVPRSDSLTLSYNGITVNSGTTNTVELPEEAINKIMSIKNRENIAEIAPKLLGTLQTNSGQILAVGVNFDTEFRIKKWWQLDGNKPQASHEVILGSTASKILKKEVGSKISVGNRELVVTGVLKEIGSEEDNVLYVSLPELQNILNKEGKLSFIEVSALCYSCPIEEIVAQISSKLPEAKVTAILEAVESRKAIVDKFSILARTVSLIVLFIGSLILSNTVLLSINERNREIGVFRALGFKKRHIAAIIVLETAIVSILGSLIGYLLGIVLAKWLAPLIAQMEVPILWDWQLGIRSLILTVLVGVMASLLPVYKAVKHDPAHSMRLI